MATLFLIYLWGTDAVAFAVANQRTADSFTNTYPLWIRWLPGSGFVFLLVSLVNPPPPR